MNEKIIIRSEKKSTSRLVGTWWGICIAFCFFMQLVSVGPDSFRLIVIILNILMGTILTLPAIIFVLMYSKVSITVTDKRVYGTAAFGRRVDLPMDSISAVGISMFKGVSVATSAGKIKFAFIKNRDDIQKAISEQLLLRQTAKESPAVQDSADELKKYKDLLDSGTITQEEFDAKKKQLLGL